MPDQPLDYAAIERKIETGIANKKKFYHKLFFGVHLTFFASTLLVIWAIALSNSQLRETLFNTSLGAAMIIILPTIVWAMVMLIHTAVLYIESNAAEESMRQELLANEFARQMLREGLAKEAALEKSKNRFVEEKLVRLSTDGELMSVDEYPFELANNETHSEI